MTNEERDLITRFVERAGGTAAPASGAGQSAVAALPPLDREADALIADLFNRYPEARYRITQMAVVQEHALVEAQNRISRLQWELQQARQGQATSQGGTSPWGAAGVAAGAAAAQPQQSRGFFSNLFGGGGAAQGPAQQQQYSAAPPPPQYPPGYNPGMFQQQGSGFLGSALRTAAGVAGGVVAADALMGLFSGNHGMGGGFGGGGFGSGGYEQGGGGAFGAPGGADPYDVGGAAKDEPGSDKFAGGGNVDQSAWQPSPDQGGGGGWQDASNQGGGWEPAPDQSSGGGWQDASDQSGGGDSGGGSDFQDV